MRDFASFLPAISSHAMLCLRPLKVIFYLSTFLIFSLIPTLIFTPLSAGAAPQKSSIGETFLGEKLTYEIGFWLFEKVALAELTLEKEDEGYRAVLRAHTTGFVDRVIQHRVDEYVAHLRETPEGGRFITTSFESSYDVNYKVRYGLKEVDMAAGVLKKHSWGGGKDEKREEVRFKPNTYIDDPLGAFYNFRYGVYGLVKAGAKLSVKTFPTRDYKAEKMVMVFSRVDGESNEQVFSEGPEVKEKATYSARVKMSKEVFGSDLTDIEIYFGEALLPLRATARDIAFFTDVWGTLLSVGRDK